MFFSSIHKLVKRYLKQLFPIPFFTISEQCDWSIIGDRWQTLLLLMANSSKKIFVKTFLQFHPRFTFSKKCTVSKRKKQCFCRKCFNFCSLLVDFFFPRVSSIWKSVFSLTEHRSSVSSVGPQDSKISKSQWPSVCYRVPDEERGFGHGQCSQNSQGWNGPLEVISSPRQGDDLDIILLSLLWWWHCLGAVKHTWVNGAAEKEQLMSPQYCELPLWKVPASVLPAWGKDVQKMPLLFWLAFHWDGGLVL